MSKKIKKYVLPYFPYLIAFWFFSKCGTAYRMASGANLGEKLFGMVKTIGPVFQSYVPGLGLFDLAVGVAGAVILYFVVQSKIKKARKFRRDMEYGSARWGTEADIKPFVDPKFENNVILTGTEFLTMNTRPKNPANARNLNACVIGSSGSGKTRFWLTPQLLQAHSSYVVVDPKGGTLSQCGHFLQRKKGYKVKVFNSIDFSKSMHYNPMSYIKTESDVLKFVNALIANTKGDGKEGDEFWTKAETLLYCALVAYKKVKKNKSASRAPAGESIEQRPEEIDEREEFGHWEGDTVYSGKGKRKTTRALLTLTERKTRKEIIIAIPNRKAETVVKALDALERKLGARRFRAIFKSITFDNGTEFAAAEELERSCINKHLPRTKVYFCHPYSSWERGTNENTNGMIRRRFPKGTNFAAVTNAQITQAENWINNYPRKILGYKSSEIVFRECLRELGIAA